MNHRFLFVSYPQREIFQTYLLVNIWNACTGQDLVLTTSESRTASLVKLSSPKDDELFASLIENMDGKHDDFPLFIIWDNEPWDAPSGMCVHEYAPFENGIRQLVREYRSFGEVKEFTSSTVKSNLEKS